MEQEPLRWYLTVAGFLRPPSSIPSDFLEIEQSLSKVNSQWPTRSKVYCFANWNVLDCKEQRESHILGTQGDECPKSMLLFARKPPPGPSDTSHTRDLNYYIYKTVLTLPQTLSI